MRLSPSNFAGTARTLVAVGMVSERSMFFAITAFAPRIGLTRSPSLIFTVGALLTAGLGGAGGAGRVGAGGAWAGGSGLVAVASWPLTVPSSAALLALVVAMPWL